MALNWANSIFPLGALKRSADLWLSIIFDRAYDTPGVSGILMSMPPFDERLMRFSNAARPPS